MGCGSDLFHYIRDVRTMLGFKSLEPVKGAAHFTLWSCNGKVVLCKTRCQTLTGSDWLR